MSILNLTKILASYKSGWVALDKQNKVVAHAKDFATLSKKTKGKKDIVAMPAATNYFGFVT